VHAIRKHILDILKAREGATVADLAECLNMAPVSVRHHLDILQADNLICVDRLERKGSVGRPQQVYALTSEANELFPDNFAALAAGLVRQLKRVLSPEQVEAAFKALAQDFAGPLSARLEGLPVEARLEQVTHFLNERGYLARWEVDEETGDGSFLLHKCNCPYAGVSDEHDELCLMDQALINTLMGDGCRRIQSMAKDARCCTYRVELRDAAGEANQGTPAAIPLLDLEWAEVEAGVSAATRPEFVVANGVIP
jgi:predicted ArsR family transcriptional regulator